MDDDSRAAPDTLADGISTVALRRVIDGVLGRVLSGADVRRVYGEPVVKDELTVIPVAEVRYSFALGGGGGEGDGGEGGGAGGGGTISARPVGYLEISDDESRFVPITDASRLALVGAIVAGLGLLTLLRRLLR